MSARVGVLLPVRIETAFDPHEGGGCRLRVLVVPDAVWIDRHDDTVRTRELDALDAAWQECGGDFHALPAGPRAFARLAAAYGGARAAWLARRFPAVPVAGGADRTGARLRRTPRGAVIRGLPRRIEIWVTLLNPPPGGPGRVHLDTLELTDRALRVELGPGAAAPGEEIFRPSWEAARAAGLTADIELAEHGVDPADIGVLYAVGLGETEPLALFAAHRDAGALGILATGMPTNTVAGAPAADLGQDDASWLRTVRPPLTAGDEALLSVTLTGRADRIGPVYSPERSSRGDPLPAEPCPVLDHGERGSLLVRSLWPALWGANLKDVWGIEASDPTYVSRLGLWAGEFLTPEGPLPPIRVGDQPYGVLPVTALARWDAVGDPHDVEARLVPHLVDSRALWARQAEAAGTVAGADADRVLALTERTPVTARLTSTLHLPLEVFQLMQAAFPPGLIAQWWRRRAELPRRLRGGEPMRAFVEVLAQMDLELPLVEPAKPQDEPPWIHVRGRSLFMRAIIWFAETFAGGLDVTFFERLRRHGQPRSLLFRLIAHAAVLAASEVVRTGKGLVGPVGPGEGRLYARFEPGAVPGSLDTTPAGGLFRDLWNSLGPLAREDPRVLERTFLATLDTASHRIDPWLTAVAWRRLRSAELREEPRAIGAYGWVDRPFRGTRGPTEAGLLLAPSAIQARAAVILRDKAVYDREPAAGALPGTRRWDMSLDSARVRMADRVATSVRMGAHLGEALGAEIERIFAARSAIDTLRRHYQLRDGDRGRRVCDGEKVLRRTTAEIAADTGLVIGADQTAQLAALRETIDVYGDLLVANAVFDVVSGRGGTAGASMEAAAGLAIPPSLEVIRTPRAGRLVSTVVVAALDDRPVDPLPGASPVWLAEPALASHVAATFPAADRWTWTREDRSVSPAGETITTSTTVSLADLDLDPVDLLVLDPEQVAGLVVAHTSEAAPAIYPKVLATGAGPGQHARLRRLAGALVGRPAMPTALAVDGRAVAPAEDGPVVADLWARYRAVHAEAVRVRDALHQMAGAVNAPADGGAELALAVRWGVLPVPPPDAIDLDAVALRRELLRVAAGTFDARLERAPAATPQPSLSAERIAEAVGGLVAPGGRLPVFSRVARAQIASASGPAAGSPLVAEPFEAMPLPDQADAGRNRLDRTWLEVVSAVRPAAARIEGYQLEAWLRGWPALRAWTNWPGNPWQEGVPRPAPADEVVPPALLVAYGPAGTLEAGASGPIAAIVVDAWTETIPAQEHTVTAAFGFNAPAARAPQAILVAVPPIAGAPLDAGTLLDIVVETRESAHARMASPLDLQRLAAALPLTLAESFYADRAGLELASWERP